MSIRPPTHAGSWYSASSSTLSSQIQKLFAAAEEPLSKHGGSSVPGARVLVGPHAGYAYSGPQLAETYRAWDCTGVKRVFVLGPSHHVYFSSSAKLSAFHYYETPLGNLPVDTEVCAKLAESKHFSYMSAEEDEDEHSFEMHAPFIYHRAHGHSDEVPRIVPIMISAMSDTLYEGLVEQLEPFFKDPANTFAVSSDFCHWGSRFGYTEYLPTIPQKGHPFNHKDLVLLNSSRQVQAAAPIHRSIEALDKEAMRVAAEDGYKAWNQYIKNTGNTICGQKPMAVVLRLLHASGKGFVWIGYSQSSRVSSPHDSSVSYASGYVAV